MNEHDADLEIARIRDLLGRPDPATPIERRILASTLNKIDAEKHSPAPETTPPARRRTTFVVAASVLALLVVALPQFLAVPAMATPAPLEFQLGRPQDTSTAPLAHDILLDLSESSRTASISGSGNVHFTESFGWNFAVLSDESRATIVAYSQQAWFAENGASRVDQYQRVPIHTDGTIDSTPALSPEPSSRDEAPEGSFTPYERGLSSEPGVLRSQLLEGMPDWCHHSNSEMGWCLLYGTREILSYYAIPGDLQSALWLVLANEPGVRTLGTTTDRVGRPAIAITHAPITLGTEEIVLVLLIDPTDGRFIGTEEITLVTEIANLDVPAVTGFTTIIAQKLVTDIGAIE